METMQYPLIDRELLSSLRLVHAGYNSIVILLFFYHATLGFSIRRARRAGAPLPYPKIKRHRKAGPVFAVMGLLGFFIGFSLVLLDTGNLLEYPLHFIVGLLIVLCLVSTFVISRKIKAGPEFRTPHFILGIALLCLYCIEAFLGLGVLL